MQREVVKVIGHSRIKRETASSSVRRDGRFSLSLSFPSWAVPRSARSAVSIRPSIAEAAWSEGDIGLACFMPSSHLVSFQFRLPHTRQMRLLSCL